jgi:hypothetical protein
MTSRRKVFSFLLPLFCFVALLPLTSAQTPQTNQYTLSAQGGAPFSIDDGLDVSINGTIVFSDGGVQSTTNHPPVSFMAKQGDTLMTVVNDTFGHCTGVSPLYLACGAGSTPVLADPGLVEFCGRPGGNQGVSHRNTFTIPAMNCGSVSIGAVEFTQAIQQYQALADLKSSLTANGEPPVPLIANKPGVMRVYFASVTDASDVTLTVSGTISESKTLSLQPACSPPDQRAHNNSCPSMDFYFTPPAGSWTVTLTLTDSKNNQLEQDTLTVNSRTTNAINLKGVEVCNTSGGKTCGSPSLLSLQTGSLNQLMPTASVTTQYTWNKLQDDVTKNYYDITGWDIRIAAMADALYTPADQSTDFASNQRTTYFAVYNPKFGVFNSGAPALVDYSGWAAGIPSHGAMGPDNAIYLGVDDTPGTVAHEVGHTLDLQHTNLQIPAGDATAQPGCFGLAKSPPTYWHYPTNQIQSTQNGLEYGFDVANQKIIIPASTYDLMSYCLPQWISPIQYKRMVTTLGGGAVSSPSVSQPVGVAQARLDLIPESVALPRLTPTVVPGPYWQIAGTITSTGVTFNPVFKDTIAGSPDPGTGTYSIALIGASGQTLYTRNFTPQTSEGDTSAGTTVDSLPYFSQWIPVTAGTTSFRVLDPNGITLATLPISGTAPTITLTSPVAGFVGTGTETLSWTISGTSAPTLTSRILFSRDNGATWIPLGDIPGTTDVEDFSQLPGTSTGLMRILVSDGVNTGSTTSAPFTVTKKKPSSIFITSPVSGFAQAAADPVYLSGFAFDADDGFLQGAALQWSSSVQGALGIGSPLSVTLKPGTHTITLTGTDSDGNAVTATTSVTIGGARPALTLTTAALTSTCTGATITAVPGIQGAPLATVQYSLNGGTAYTNVALGKLPYTFVVPGTGSVSLVARAYDVTNQSAASSTNLTLASACVTGIPSVSGGNSQNAPVGTAFATPLAVIVQDGSGNPVSGVTVTFTAPTTGASATLSAASAVTATNGIASVTATANSTTGAYIVTGSVIGFGTTVPFNLTNSDFTLAVDNAAITVNHGSSTNATFTLSSVSGFAAPVTFTCGTLPTGVTCAFNPATVTPTGATVTSVLTISASNAAKVTARNLTLGGGGVVFAVCLLGSGLRRRRKILTLLVLLASVALVVNATGCGANFNPFSATVNVTATSGSLTHTQTLTVNVK